MPDLSLFKKYSFHISIIAMILLVIGTFIQGGMAQKILFVVGAPILAFTAYLNGQKTLMTLQTVITLGAILAFFKNLPPIVRYSIMVGSSVAGIAYLIKINYYEKDKWWPMAGLGLIGIALGFATNAAAYPVLFNSLIGIGGILVAVYSAIGFFVLEDKIAVIWLILNIIFSINPMRIVISSLI